MLSFLEWAANATFVVSVVLAARNHLYTWWTGIIGCILFAVLFYQVNLYADVTLMVFFIATSLYGWMYWSDTEKPSIIQRTSPWLLLLFVAAAIIATLLYGWLLFTTTNAYAPFIDSAVLMFSVLAQFLLMKRRIESWICWLIVDTIAVPLYASRELYLTSFVYGLFWCNAWYGLCSWYCIYKKEEQRDKQWKKSVIAVD